MNFLRKEDVRRHGRSLRLDALTGDASLSPLRRLLPRLPLDRRHRVAPCRRFCLERPRVS